MTPFRHDDDVEVEAVVGRVRRVAETRADASVGREDLEGALRSIGQLQAWLAGSHAAITSRLAAQVSFPEQAIAECTRGTTRDAIKDKERADLLGSAPGLADALDDARVTAGHVDEVTKATKGLEGEQRQELIDRVEGGLLDVAEAATIEEFGVGWRSR